MAGMNLQTPCLLVANPLLLDPNFLHTVVLLIEHDEQGAMGIVLNRSLPLNLAQICAESQLTFAGDEQSTAFRGGPVEPQRGIILVRGGLPAEEDTVLDFTDFVSFRKDLLASLLLDPTATFRWAEAQGLTLIQLTPRHDRLDEVLLRALHPQPAGA